MTSVSVSAFTFHWLPDGQDTGTGLIRFTTASGYTASTSLGVSRVEWNQFAAKVRGL